MKSKYFPFSKNVKLVEMTLKDRILDIEMIEVVEVCDSLVNGEIKGDEVMDPIVELNSEGSGKITFYHFGVSYVGIKVSCWVVEGINYQRSGTVKPGEWDRYNPNGYAQKLVNRYYANLADHQVPYERRISPSEWQNTPQEELDKVRNEMRAKFGF